MEIKKNYMIRGTPDLPIATYIGVAEKNMKRWSKYAEFHTETEISLVVRGSVTMQLGQSQTIFHSGDIFIIPSNLSHRRVVFSSDTLLHAIVFSPNAIRMDANHFFQQGFVLPLLEDRLELPRLLQPGHPAYDAVYDQMMRLESCRIYEKNFKQYRLSVLMNICLALMPHCQVITDEIPISDPGHEGVKLCMRYLHNHHAKKISIPEVAGYCHLHPNYLSAVFRQYTGESIIEYLTRIRIESAQRLLRENLPVNKVAEMAGFRSECLFYRKFKDITGMTPKTYQRKQLSPTQGDTEK